MKYLSRVSTLEVKRSFVLAQRFTSKKMRKPNVKKYIQKPDKKYFEKEFVKAKKQVFKLSEMALDRIIAEEYPKRLRLYGKLQWFYGKVNINEIGLWKGAGGLPLGYTYGSLGQSATKVKRELLKQKSNLGKSRVKRVVPEIIQFKPFIKKQKILSAIIMESDANKANRKGLRRTKFSIDDGCMRSLAFAVSGDKNINAYIGLLEKKK